ncbi:MAG: hypothetical protein U0U70_01700 [Chitinophagaceae bacterium]
MSGNQTAIPLPEIFIGTEKVNQRITLYMQNKRPLLNGALSTGGTTREETKSIWYSKEHLETLLSEINLMQGDGIRIYFGAYESDNDIAPDQLCLLMMVTRPGVTAGSHADIIYENEPGFAERKEATTRSKAFHGNDSDTEGRPKPFNYGAPCPPIC